MKLTRRQWLLSIAAASVCQRRQTDAAGNTWSEACELCVRWERAAPSCADLEYTNALQWSKAVIVVYGLGSPAYVNQRRVSLRKFFTADEPVLGAHTSPDFRAFAFAVPGKLSKRLQRELPSPAFAF